MLNCICKYNELPLDIEYYGFFQFKLNSKRLQLELAQIKRFLSLKGLKGFFSLLWKFYQAKHLFDPNLGIEGF